jgi:hypothetical protein
VWAECRYFIYKNSVRTSQETHYVSVAKRSRLMLFRETVAVYCVNHTEHKYTVWPQLELLNDCWFTASPSSRQAPRDPQPAFFQLNTCFHSFYITSSLTRGWVCRLRLLLTLTSAVILRSECSGTHDHILLSLIRDSFNLEGQVPVLIYPRNRLIHTHHNSLQHALSHIASERTT